MQPLSSREHLPALDGLRGFAVLLVLARHLARHAVDGAAGDPFAEAVVNAALFGWVGVDLFFVLSGFLITGILFDNRRPEGGVAPGYFRTFYGRRALRIFPLYYAGLVVYCALAWALATVGAASPGAAKALLEMLPWHLGYLTNIRLAIADTLVAAPMNTAHLWSLAVEEQFYLLWPAVIAAACTWLRRPRRALIALALALACSATLVRVSLLPTYPLAAYVLLPARVDALMVGALLALCGRGRGGLSSARRWAIPCLGVSGTALLILAVPTAGLGSLTSPLQQTVGFPLWALTFGALLVLSVTAPSGSRLRRALTVRPLIATGQISYGLYLIHYPLIYLLLPLKETLGFAAFATVVVLSSFLLAVLSWRYFEAPVLRLKRLFPYPVSRAGAGHGAAGGVRASVA